MPLDPTDPAFDLAAWGEDGRRERRRRDEEQRRRDTEWREELRTRRRFKNGNELLPRYVLLPVPGAGPGAPRFVLVRQDP